MLGRCIEQYRIEALIGEGAHAGVYRAVHGSLGSVHALKVPWFESDEARAALLREGRAQASVRHPNLVGVTDVIGGEVPALVLEYVTGPTLEAWLARDGDGLAAGGRVVLFAALVDGVRAIHRAGLVHGDLKPANILLAPTPDGWQPKVTDFGVARRPPATGEAPSGGTSGYMAPEQIVGGPVDARADLFALGCVMFELLTGRPAFPGADAIARARATIAGLPAPELEAIPEELRSVVAGLLERDPAARTPSCAVLAQQLAPWTGTPSGPLTMTPVPPLPAPSRPRPHRCALGPLQQVAAAGAVGGMALGFGVLACIGLHAAPPPAPVAAAEPDPVEVVAAAVVASARPEVQRVAVRASVPVPAALPEEPPPARTGRIVLRGDAAVTLRGPDGAWSAPGAAQPGEWSLSARFDGGRVVRETFRVEPGQEVVVRCSSFAVRCITR